MGWAEGEQGGAGAGAWAGDPTILGVMGCTKGLGKPLPPHYTQWDKGVEGAERVSRKVGEVTREKEGCVMGHLRNRCQRSPLGTESYPRFTC